MGFTGGGGVGSTVEISEVESLANGTIIIGDGSGAPTTLAAFSGATGTLKPANGGTGVANNAASTLTISGNFATTLTVSGVTGVTLPTAGTLATLTGTEVLTNKDLTATTNSFTAASTTQTGVAEAATADETTTGTDAARYVSPDALAGSTTFGYKSIELTVFDYTVSCATGDGKGYFPVPLALNGMNLVRVYGRAITAGTTGTMDVQINNVTQAADMFTTKLTWDSTEAGTDTAAAAVVIDANNDDVATNDLLRIDCDAVQTTPAAGMILVLEFALP